MPVQSPDKGGFIGKASNLPIVKQPHQAQSIDNAVSKPGRITRITTHARNRNSLYRRKQQIRIARWNIKTLFSNDHEIIPVMNEHKIDICALYETKKKDKRITRYSGVVTKEHIENIKYVNDRILKLTISFINHKYILYQSTHRT